MKTPLPPKKDHEQAAPKNRGSSDPSPTLRVQRPSSYSGGLSQGLGTPNIGTQGIGTQGVFDAGATRHPLKSGSSPKASSFPTPVALLSLPGERPFNPSYVEDGRYQFGDILGEGGMGKVISALDKDLGRVVALKTLRDEQKTSAAHLQALIFEARLTGQLEHPNIVPVHELGTLSDGTPFYTMKLIGDLSLQDVLRQLAQKSPLALKHYTQKNLLQYFRSLCLALEYAHARGVIHRDLKPDNVLIGEYGEVQILDWGVARVLPREDRPGYFAGQIEEEGAIIGTPHYMSPEQAQGDTPHVDAKSDVYALGVILYQLLTYTLPFHDEPQQNPSSRIYRDKPELPSRRAPSHGIHPVLDAICMKAMALSRDERYASALSLSDDIEMHLAGEQEKARLLALANEEIHRAQEAAMRFYEASKELLILDEEVRMDEQAARHLDPLIVKKAAWQRKLNVSEKRMVEARLFSEAVLGFQRAMAHVPEHEEAQIQLSKLYSHRAHLAQIRSEETEYLLYSDLSRATHPHANHEEGQLSVRAYPERVLITISELTTMGLNAVHSAQAPVVNFSLPPGSYIVSANLRGHAERRSLVVIEPLAHAKVLLSLTPWDATLPVVAQSDDLMMIRDAFNAAVSQKRLGSFMVIGAPGLGKRRLLDEFGEWLDKIPELVIYGSVRPQRIHRHVPFYTMTELLGHRAGILRFDEAELILDKLYHMIERAYLEAKGRQELSPHEAKHIKRQAKLIASLPPFRDLQKAEFVESRTHTIEVFEAVTDYLRLVCESAPVVLAIRGADNLDRLSRDLLFFIAERLSHMPLFCLMFSRQDKLELQAEQNLRLSPLNDERLRQQLTLLLRGRMTENVVQVISHLSKGNPFQIAESVRILAKRGELLYDGQYWRLLAKAERTLSESSFEKLLLRAARALSDSAYSLLVEAAIQGPTFWLEVLLQHGHRIDALEAALEEWLDHELVILKSGSHFVGTREVAFRFDSLSEWLIRELSLDEREQHHRVFAEWVQKNGARSLSDLALAAQHAELGGQWDIAFSLRGELALEAARWEVPQASADDPAWFDWPDSLLSSLF